jgi:hypothetical protein
MIDSIAEQFGFESKEMQELFGTIRKMDSINLVKVTRIIDKHGWPGIDKVGQQGASTVFLVIQHSDAETRAKYLPMMRQAVKDGKANGGELALLEDRIALEQGRKQIYGSQIMRNEDGSYSVLPLEDPDHVDKRRLEVGLPPLRDYVSRWGIEWDVKEYKKNNP